ncbi:MAG: diguanylate cyclase [Christensenellales bacterium]
MLRCKTLWRRFTSASVRTTSLRCFGGDEFVIWMDGIHLGDVEAIKEKIQEVNHRTVLVANMTMRISVSAGVTFCRYGDAYKDALRRVDTALYEMKRTGSMAAPCMKNYKSKPPFSGKWGRTVILFAAISPFTTGRKKCYC